MTDEVERLKRELADALAVVYQRADKCVACREHVATRYGATDAASPWVCDRADCAEKIVCGACDDDDDVPANGETTKCFYCGSTDVRRVYRSMSWTDLTHAATLRAANSSHGAP